MARPSIEGEIRTERGKNAARRTRVVGKVPAVLYGTGSETLAVTLDPRQLIAALQSHGHNTIFDLRLNGEASPSMVVDWQIEPVKGKLLHVDLKRIAMDRKLKVAVPVIITGEAKGVKTQGGLMEVVLREVEVECLPDDIPDHLTVAVDDLGLNEAFRIADLQKILDAKVQLVGDSHAVICHVVMPKAEEVAPAAEAAADASTEPEVIKKGKAVEEGAEAAEAGEKKPEKGEKKK